MLDFTLSLPWEPVIHDVGHLLVAVLPETQQKKVVVHESELAAVVVDAVRELVNVLDLVDVIEIFLIVLGLVRWSGIPVLLELLIFSVGKFRSLHGQL